MKSLIFSTLYFCSLSVFAQTSVVHSVGSMSDMGKENFAPHINLDTVSTKVHFFGMGPLGRMQGEITIINGKPFGASVNEKGEGVVQENWQIEAPFFVYANVAKWKKYPFSVNINNLDDLQKAVAQIAQQNGFDLQQSFPFRLVGTIATLTTHIVMPRSPEIAGYQANKKQADYDLANQKGELLGFYSEKHQGIYTHKDSFIHVHFVSKDQKTMGHVDKIKDEDPKLTLYLPVPTKRKMP
jgi:acetolactate decarboxylase